LGGASRLLTRLWDLVLPTLVCLDPSVMAMYVASQAGPLPDKPTADPRPRKREQLRVVTAE